MCKTVAVPLIEILVLKCVIGCIADIEDLTHKTGNFKQFDVFVSMLESALEKVMLEMLLISILSFVLIHLKTKILESIELCNLCVVSFY